MVKRVSSKEVRARFDEIADAIRDTGEPVIVEKEGQPAVALVSLQDFDTLDRARREGAASDFTRLAREAARRRSGPGPTEDEVLEAIKHSRGLWYREHYGRG